MDRRLVADPGSFDELAVAAAVAAAVVAALAMTGLGLKVSQPLGMLVDLAILGLLLPSYCYRWSALLS